MAFDWQPREPDAERARGYVRAGFWNDESLGGILATGLRAVPDHAFTVRSERFPFRGTFAAVDDLACRVAAGLRARGIGPGDAVAFQLPNWVDAAATFYAIAYLGAIVVPIVHFYGAKEVGYILRRTRVKALVTADRFGHQDFLANLETIRAEGNVDDLEWVAVVGDSAPGGAFAFSELLGNGRIDAPVAVDPMAPALIAYTSGTTADPKGVVHVHRTINAEIRQLSAIQPNQPGVVEDPDAIDMLTGAPVGHGIGMLAALLTPVFRRRNVHLIDVWDPKRVLAAMAEDHLSAGQGATFFLTSLLDHPDFDPAVHGPLMAHIGLGGAAVPIAVCERARALGIECSRSFGSTEHPSITGSTFEDPFEQRACTDGRPLPGVEMRLIGDDGRDVGVGEPGEIISRGPDCFFGYTDPARTAEAIDADGWFATGDVGVLDEAGCLSITDRKKDIIIRGGENISAQEVEELIARIDGVAECAVVAAPDPRLGEHAAVFVRMQSGHDDPSLDHVRAQLDAAGLARQKWPEELRSVGEFPRTPSGKVQKFVLRQRLRDETQPAGSTRA
jgi:acyl-CoA synthetase (AMP-forming)/AMP-acid ligase II